MEQSQALITNETHFQFLWKGHQTTLNEELNKLSQFTRVYASATINKDAEIQLLMKEKDQRIFQLEQTFQIEKQEIEKKWQTNLTKMQKRINDLKI